MRPDDTVSILLVDDRRENLVALEALLAAPQHKLVMVGSGEDALREAAERDFALILLDVQMPGMDGIETTRRLRAGERTRQTPVLLVTANGDDVRLLSAGYAAGAADYLAKPFLAEVLKAKVAIFVELWRVARENKRQSEALVQAERELQARLAQLEQSNRELQSFALVASHDLQEPLRKVQAFGDLLKEEYGELLPGEAREYLQEMRDAAGRMQNLIHALLALSRVSTRGRAFVPVDLRQAAEQALDDLAVAIEEAGARVELGELATIEADPIQVRQLLQNLIGNAVKYRRKDVPVHVRVESRVSPGRDPWTQRSAEVCHLVVVDNGIGFDEKYLDRIFVPFQRLHSRSGYEGTGMGLAICRRIAERHGGEIRARSTPGEGSVFIVTLPVAHFRENADDEGR